MINQGLRNGFRNLRRKVSFTKQRLGDRIPVLVLALLGALCFASFNSRAEQPVLPQDTGFAGLKQTLQKLSTTARLMHTTAHPDDEDAAVLTYEARGEGASVVLFTLNRGEGGQNKTGSGLFDALGILRTEELLAADNYYGVEQRFSHVTDFGFSKTPEESISKWKGQEPALGDMVRVIRTFRPDVLVSRFSGTPRDGHGHHQASGVLTPLAFKAAGDPKRFPEQIREGLLPWQPKKLYMPDSTATGRNNANTQASAAPKPAPKLPIVRITTSTPSEALGMTFAQFAAQGYVHHVSQGSGGNGTATGVRVSSYELRDSVLPAKPAPGQEEKGFFDGIDTTLPGLATRLGREEAKVPYLRPALVELEQKVTAATAALNPQDLTKSAPPLLAGLEQVKKLIARVSSSTLSPAAKLELLTNLRTKQSQFAHAANLAVGAVLEVMADRNDNGLIVPGQTFTLTARLTGQGALTDQSIDLDLPAGWQKKALPQSGGDSGPSNNYVARFQVMVASNAAYTKPYWHRTDPQIESLATIDAPQYRTLPFPPPPVRAHATYRLGANEGEIHAVAEAKVNDPTDGPVNRPLAVAPALAVQIQPATQLINSQSPEWRGSKAADETTVTVHSNVNHPVRATLRLIAPAGWQVQPAFRTISLKNATDSGQYKFKVKPVTAKAGYYNIKAVATYHGKQYSEGFDTITRNDLATFYYYSPARQRVSDVAVKVPNGLRVGYVMGTGDSIPTVLKQLGINVELITPEDMASGDLNRFQTIVLGIRVYDVRKDVIDNNKRLLEFVNHGGTLIVQYNQANTGQYAPYPATSSSQARVTVEEAPVVVLDPKDPIFHSPNEITQRDFDNWIQERGLYFMTKWDEHMKPLLSSHDPNEEPLKGGLLEANYGKGTYIFTGYAFFRQLPAGVPGPIRLFVNILNAGHHD